MRSTTVPDVWASRVATLSASLVRESSVDRADVLGHSGAAYLRGMLSDRDVVAFVSPAVARLHGERITSALTGAGIPPVRIRRVATGEHNKTLGSVAAIVDAIHSTGLGRNGVVLGIGGGVLLDMVALAASLYRRGVGAVKIPTTLLGQVDAGVGLKCGVNTAYAKNLIGDFYPPERTVLDAQFLPTLGPREIQGGLAEIIKLAMVADRDLFGLLERHSAELDAPRMVQPHAGRIVDLAVSGMVRELQQNPYEHVLARRVDFGHTVSPQLEISSSHRVTHGQAVAIDSAYFSAVSYLSGRLSGRSIDRIVSLFGALALPGYHEMLDDPETIENCLAAAAAHRGGRLNQPLLNDIGEAVFVQRDDLSPKLLCEAAGWVAAHFLPVVLE